MNAHKKYRLRKKNRIVGYAQETKNGINFKGKEILWYMRNKIYYDQVDEYIGVKDVLNREIYELDIVKYHLKKKAKEREGVVLWETRSNSFVVLDIQSRHYTPIFIEKLFLFRNDSLEVVSHLFNHPKLITDLGLKF